MPEGRISEHVCRAGIHNGSYEATLQFRCMCRLESLCRRREVYDMSPGQFKTTTPLGLIQHLGECWCCVALCGWL